MVADGQGCGLILTIESRALKCTLGPLAWAGLEDVSLDAVHQDGRWLAATSTRRLADHLGLTPGTVARALARLCSEGLVHREDRRDTLTGRFGESVYVIVPMTALVPCVDPPHTARRDTETPNTASPATVSPYTALPSEVPPGTEEQRREPGQRRPGSSGRRRTGNAEQQLLLGAGESATTQMTVNPSTPTTTQPELPNSTTPTTHNPIPQQPYNTEPLNTTTQRPADTCQLSQAGPGRASC